MQRRREVLVFVRVESSCYGDVEEVVTSTTTLLCFAIDKDKVSEVLINLS